MSATTTERIAAARAALDREYPPAWMPHEQGHPTEVAGVFKRLEEGPTARGPAAIAILEDDTGVEFSVWLLHTALRSSFVRQQPAAGEAVAIRYLGKRTSGSGQQYDDYKVVVHRDTDATSDWSRVSGAGSPPPPTPPSGAAAENPAAANAPAAAGGPPAAAPRTVCPGCGGEGGTHWAGCTYDEIPY